MLKRGRIMIRFSLLAVTLCTAPIWGDGARAQMLPSTLAAPGEAVVVTIHAEGAQIYGVRPTAVARSPGYFVNPLQRYC